MRGGGWIGGLLLALTALGCESSPQPPRSTLASPVQFSEREREIIKEFYGRYHTPPGLAQPESLAPTLEERLERSAVVPPDLAAFPLPLQLERRLSALPPGYQRFRTGGDVVLMDIRTRQVLDVVPRVLRPSGM